MALKTGILIEHKDQKVAIEVDNYSKENVIKTLSAALMIDEEHLEQLSASMTYGLYGVKKTTKLKDVLNSGITGIKGLSNDETLIVFKVEYIKIIK